jgi:Fe-S oxidoreductase
VEYGGQTKEESDRKARAVMEMLKKKPNPPSMKLFDDPQEEHDVWLVRRGGLGATAHVPNKKITWEGWEDSAVPPDRVGDYLRDLRKLLTKYGYGCDLYGHFGQGCIHTRIDFDLETAEGIKTFEAFLHEAAHLVVSYGGSISGEHGDGQSKAELLPIMFGNDLIEAFNQFKSIWDPGWKMNPGKVVRPYKADQNLRLGTDYDPPVPVTFFKFPGDDGNFNRVTLRCVGTGECRRHYGGTICPSYRVTREEMHSTRGRAHLLFEMMKGEVITGGWKDEHVKESLHYCLACKGCKGDCPVKVDMATYKAEFLAHYYQGRLRPIQDYAFGMIYRWSRMAAWMPAVVNFLTQAPGLRTIAKGLVNMAQERQIPQFAPETFKEWFFRRPPKNHGKPRVILWPDTFNNHFHPETARAAVEVLEHAGFQVTVPRAHLCCGRSLYDSGQLPRAQALLRQILDTLQEDIRGGVPIIGLEPACTAVFRDELTNLYPFDEDAKRLSRQTFTLAEFLDKHNYQPPQLKRRAIVHGHCHQKAIMGMEADQHLLQKMGLDFTLLDDGCCGMAGSFGFEKSKYDVSIKVGNTGLLPHVRDAGDETLVITDGFSCREQIAQTTERRGLHLAQVLQMALQAPVQVPGERPEAPLERRLSQAQQQANKRLAAVTGGVALVGLAWLALRQRRKD